jgi:type I restriction enzyme S subunit
MKLETFFEKFDQFADAPDAVAKMRELVLHLAITGKLVPQDPNDEPAEDSFPKLASLALESDDDVGRSNGVVEWPLFDPPSIDFGSWT